MEQIKLNEEVLDAAWVQRPELIMDLGAFRIAIQSYTSQPSTLRSIIEQHTLSLEWMKWKRSGTNNAVGINGAYEVKSRGSRFVALWLVAGGDN